LALSEFLKHVLWQPHVSLFCSGTYPLYHCSWYAIGTLACLVRRYVSEHATGFCPDIYFFDRYPAWSAGSSGRKRDRTHRQYSFGRFLLKYVLLIGIYAIAWYLFSLPSLLIFLLISAWHFGETDVEKVPSKAYLWMANRFLHGAFVLAWLLLGHAAETTPILERITQSSAEELWIWQYAVAHRWQILLNGWVLISVLTWAAQQQHPAVFDAARMLRLLLVLILCQALPLLLAFTLYFAGWHSISAFQTIRAYLTAGAKGNRWHSWWNFWMLAMPFTLLAVLSSAVLAWYWQRFAQQIDPLPILFIFLSLITLPHLQVMHGMNSRVPE
jgi:beta-carotene 15,15'-dioxygenase